MPNIRTAWNRVSDQYQKNHALRTDSVSYGPWAAGEDVLQVLGDVRGKRILDVGCGGGQASIAFAKQGATVVGVDLSEAQLAFARRLAQREGFAERTTQEGSVQFVQGHAEDLSDLGQAKWDAAWDLVFSCYAFHYLDDQALPAALAEAHRLLRQRGRLVFSLDHPVRDCFFDRQEQETSIYPTHNYFDNSPVQWQFSDSEVWMESYHHTIEQWCTLLTNAKFRLVRLLEPIPPDDLLDEFWPEDGPLAPLRNLPQTIIFVAEKV